MRFRTASGKYFDEDDNPYSIGLRKSLESSWNEVFGRKQMLKGRFCINNPDSVEMTLALSMTLGDWRRLHDQIGDSFPSWKIKELIKGMIQKALVEFHAEGSTNDIK